MYAWFLSWKKRGQLQTDIARMDLQVVLLHALLGNITVPQRKNIERFCVKKVSGQMFQTVENSTL